MKYYCTAWFKVVALLFGVSVATSNMKAENTIDFSKGANLKAVYDGGLRPWRVRPDEISNLHIADQKVRVIAPNGGSFSMDVQIGDFGVLAGNQLSKADFISQPTSLGEAVRQAREAAQAFGIDIGRGDGMGGLAEKASEFAALGKQAPSPQSWRGESEIAGVRYGVTLNPLFGLNETRGKVYVAIDFAEKGKPMKFLTEPVKPPPGYEHLSMDPPPRDLSKKAFPNPEYGFKEMIQRIERARAAEGARTADGLPAPPDAAPPSPSRAATPIPSPIAETQPAESLSWSWIAGAVLLILGLGAILRKGRRN